MSFVLPTSSYGERLAAHCRGNPCPDALCARQPQNEVEYTLGIAPFSQARCVVICFVFCVKFQSPEMSYASVAMTCAGPIGSGQCPSGHRVYAKSKYDPKVWRKDQDKDEGGNVVWRHVKCRYPDQRTPSEPSFTPAASSPMPSVRPLVLFVVVACVLGI
jgi:hypothetical protein